MVVAADERGQCEGDSKKCATKKDPSLGLSNSAQRRVREKRQTAFESCIQVQLNHTSLEYVAGRQDGGCG